MDSIGMTLTPRLKRRAEQRQKLARSHTQFLHVVAQTPCAKARTLDTVVPPEWRELMQRWADYIDELR